MGHRLSLHCLNWFSNKSGAPSIALFLVFAKFSRENTWSFQSKHAHLLPYHSLLTEVFSGCVSLQCCHPHVSRIAHDRVGVVEQQAVSTFLIYVFILTCRGTKSTDCVGSIKCPSKPWQWVRLHNAAIPELGQYGMHSVWTLNQLHQCFCTQDKLLVHRENLCKGRRIPVCLQYKLLRWYRLLLNG